MLFLRTVRKFLTLIFGTYFSLSDWFILENAAQNSVKDACVVVLLVCCTVLLSANEKVDVNKLKLISSDSYCREFYPDLVSLINLLIQWYIYCLLIFPFVHRVKIFYWNTIQHIECNAFRLSLFLLTLVTFAFIVKTRFSILRPCIRNWSGITLRCNCKTTIKQNYKYSKQWMIKLQK